MKVRNNKTIQFNFTKEEATVQLTPTKQYTITKYSIFAYKYLSGWSGYRIVVANEGHIQISAKVARIISKYFELTTSDFYYDYFRFPFEKFHL